MAYTAFKNVSGPPTRLVVVNFITINYPNLQQCVKGPSDLTTGAFSNDNRSTGGGSHGLFYDGRNLQRVIEFMY